MSVYQVPRLWTPSLRSGYARSKAESANPGLWRGLVGAWVPELTGPTGAVVKDTSGFNVDGTFEPNLLANEWEMVGGRWCIDLDAGATDGYRITDSAHLQFGTGPFTTVIHHYLESSFTAGILMRNRSGGEFGTQPGFGLELQTNGVIHIDNTGIDDGASAYRSITGGGTAYTTKTWQVTAVTWTPGLTGNDFAFYLDGKFNQYGGNNSSVLGSINSGNDIQIGDFPAGSGAGLIKFGAVYLYNRVLSLQEIRQLQDPLAPFRLAPLTVVISGEEAGVTVPALDEGMLVGGLQGLQGGI